MFLSSQKVVISLRYNFYSRPGGRAIKEHPATFFVLLLLLLRLTTLHFVWHCVASSGLLAAEFCRELSAQRLYVLCVLGRLFMQESECFVFCVGCVHVYDACMSCVHCVHCMHCMHFHTKKAWLINVHYLSL